MNKRSRVAFSFLVITIILVIISLGIPQPQHSIDKEIDEFEMELVNPDNDLDVFGQKDTSSQYMLINIASKIDGIISKLFNYLINIFRAIVDGIV